jgi:hypothetical protein
VPFASNPNQSDSNHAPLCAKGIFTVVTEETILSPTFFSYSPSSFVEKVSVDRVKIRNSSLAGGDFAASPEALQRIAKIEICASNLQGHENAGHWWSLTMARQKHRNLRIRNSRRPDAQRHEMRHVAVPKGDWPPTERAPWVGR